jgi:integrase/recombinase XerD
MNDINLVLPAPHHPSNSKSLGQFINEYLASLAVRNYSPQTIESQTKQLRYFHQFCGEEQIHKLDAVTREVVGIYQTRLHGYRKKDGTPLAISTQKQWLGAVKVFFVWLIRKGHLLANPASDLEMPRKEYRLPRVILSHSEVEMVLAVPNTGKRFGLRDRAILEVFYSTGMRRSEICNLNLADVDFGREIVCVRLGKGKKDRFVPVGKRALMWVEKYVIKSRPFLGATQDKDALFVGMQGRRVNPARLASHVHRIVLRSGVGKKGSCHLFRHAFATALLENGCDLSHIQAMLGHAKLETTAIYIHLNMRDLKAAHRKFHPTSSNFDEIDETIPHTAVRNDPQQQFFGFILP